MAITSARQAELAYKKVIHGKTTSHDGSRAYYLEDNSPLSIDSEFVPIDKSLIPFSKPTVGSGVAGALVDGDLFDKNGRVQTDPLYTGNPIVQYRFRRSMALMPGTTQSYQTATSEQFILPFNFNNGLYAPIVENQANAVVPFGQNSWELDTMSGVITFYDGNPSGVTSLKLTYWKYVGRKLSDIPIASGSGLINLSYALAANALVSGVTLKDNDLDLINDTFIIDHNMNASLLIVQLKKGNEIQYPHAIRFITNNRCEIEFRPVMPLAVDNISVNLIKIA